MSYNTVTLSCGLRVIHLHSSSPVVYCGYGIKAGTRDEAEGEEGMAHFCEHATFKGTERHRSRHVISCLESVGGDLNAFTNKESTFYHAAILKDNLPRAVDLLTDIVFHSTYPEAEISREIEVICDEIESYNDSPAELIYDDFENIIFAGHPLGHNILGSAERLRTFTGESARCFTSRHYRPDNAVFFAYGDIDFRRLVRLLDSALGGIKLDGMLSGEERTSVSLPKYVPVQKIIDKSTHQAHVMLGCRAYGVNDERRMPLYLINNILGGPGMSAKFNLALRERNGLVYTVESSMLCYSDTGLWSVYFGCDPHDINRCMRLVRRELDRVMRCSLTQTQLSAAKKQIKGQIAVASDARESFAIDFAKNYLHYGREKSLERLFSAIDGITAEQIQHVAQELFAPENLTTLIYK